MKLAAACLVLMTNLCAFAQVSNTLPWTWMGGSTAGGANGTYGTQGIAAPANCPGAREGGGINWTDANGNLWLFGGYGYPASGGAGFLNDLWKYDPVTNQWTWMHGPNTINSTGNYGTILVPAASNLPPARYLAKTWTDNNGNLWMFGGMGSAGSHNDLWRYNIASGIWTWMSGDNTTNNTGVYGIQGIAAPTNKPGARNRFNESNGAIDANGCIWMFGGAGYASTSTYGCLNDLWKYNTNSNQWTWVSGDNTINNLGVYGTMGVPAAANKPGGRDGGSMVLDTAGKIWIFGGGYDASGNWNIKLSDLWKYDPGTGLWTWMKGDSSPDQFGWYNSMGVTNPSSKPGGRLMQSLWVDNYGNFWIFGGYGWAASGSVYGLNDLWKYDPLTNNWTWMAGDNTTNSTSNYGTLGVASPTNKPGNRSGDYRWKDRYGNLWKFGGLEWAGAGLRNDFWKLVIPQPVAKGNLISCQTLPEISINAGNNNSWVAIFDSIGNIAAEINGNGNSLGNIATKLFTMQGHCREDGNFKLYANRNLQIITQNAPASNVSVRLYLTKKEFDSLRLNYNSQGQQAGVGTINQVEVFKNGDSCRTIGSALALPLSATGGDYQTDYYTQFTVNSFSSFYFSSKSFFFILPVEFKSVSVQHSNRQNIIKWEADCQGETVFEVERKDNGNFKPIGSVSSTNCNQSFLFIDVSAADRESFYRIKATTRDGKISYSDIVFVSGKAENRFSIELMGSIVNSTLKILVSANRNEKARIMVVDIFGRVVFSQPSELRQGSSNFSVEVSSLPAGLYYIYMENETARSGIGRFIINR